MNKILVPLDGSRDAEQILISLDPLVRSGLHELIVVRAATMPVSDVHYPIPVGDLVDQAMRYTKGICRKLAVSGIHANDAVVVGDPGSVILRAAADHGVGMIAMATHGRSGVARVALGSVAEHVMRRADVPVWLTRPGLEAPVVVRTILVPVDGSDRSAAVLPCVTELARTFGARIVLVHAFAQKRQPNELHPPEMPLRSAELKLRGQGVEVKTDFLQGEPAQAILNAARDHGANLIALSSHGRTGLARLVMGSVAEQIVRAAATPVLVVRAGAAVPTPAEGVAHA